MRNKKRLYYLQPIKLKSLAKSGLRKSKYHEILSEGLKENEWKVIENYIKKCGYIFPLKDNKEYTWLEVKKLLKEEMNPTHNIVDDKIKEVFQNRMNEARKLIREKLSLEEERKIIAKTGFGIQLSQYRASL